MDVEEMAKLALGSLDGKDYAKCSIDMYRQNMVHVTDELRKMDSDIGCEQLRSLENSYLQKCSKGEISRSKFKKLRLCIRLIANNLSGTAVEWSVNDYPQLLPSFQDIIIGYRESLYCTHRRGEIFVVSQYFVFLQKLGHTDFQSVMTDDIASFIKERSKCCKARTIEGTIGYMCHLHDYLYIEGICTFTFSPIFF